MDWTGLVFISPPFSLFLFFSFLSHFSLPLFSLFFLSIVNPAFVSYHLDGIVFLSESWEGGGRAVHTWFISYLFPNCFRIIGLMFELKRMCCLAS